MTGGVILFYVFAAITCLGAIGVVLSQNVVRMAFWLIVSLGSSAGLFFMLHADFVGALQLMVYVGGTLVLLIFGVMLTTTGQYMKIQSSPGEGVLAGAVGFLVFSMLFASVIQVDWSNTTTKIGITVPMDDTTETYNATGMGNTARPLGLSLLGLRPDKDLGKDAGSSLSTGYLLPFEIASIHLLVVLIGASYLARAKRRAGSVD
jgi:NADH:ubiquinone oxidoreductase subunit 6 (subunit J)